MNPSVFVYVPELLEYREGFAPGVVWRLPCLKRLHRLERCVESRIEGPEFLGNLARPVTAIEDDWESDLRPGITSGDRLGRGGPAVHLGELPDEMVESGPPVVHDVAESEAPVETRRFLQALSVDDYLSGWRVRFDGDTVRVSIDERPHNLLQLGAVVFATPHAGRNAVKAVGVTHVTFDPLGYAAETKP
jgi:hypothetical protein